MKKVFGLLVIVFTLSACSSDHPMVQQDFYNKAIYMCGGRDQIKAFYLKPFPQAYCMSGSIIDIPTDSVTKE